MGNSIILWLSSSFSQTERQFQSLSHVSHVRTIFQCQHEKTLEEENLYFMSLKIDVNKKKRKRLPHKYLMYGDILVIVSLIGLDGLAFWAWRKIKSKVEEASKLTMMKERREEQQKRMEEEERANDPDYIRQATMMENVDRMRQRGEITSSSSPSTSTKK
jgi:hypothetical protein